MLISGNVNPNGETIKKLKIMPVKKAARQLDSCFCGVNKPPMTPLIPAILPLNNINNAAERPSNAPPNNDVQGVKFSMLKLQRLFVRTKCVL